MRLSEVRSRVNQKARPDLEKVLFLRGQGHFLGGHYFGVFFSNIYKFSKRGGGGL